MASIKPPGDGERRTTFRPPWVKSGPPPLPAPPPAWMGKQNQPVNSVNPVASFLRPKLREVKTLNSFSESNDTNKAAADQHTQKRASIAGTENLLPPAKQTEITVERAKPPTTQNTMAEMKEKKSIPNTVRSSKKETEPSMSPPDASLPPKGPAMQPPPPPPPPPPSSLTMSPPLLPTGLPTPGFDKKPVSKEKAQKIEALRSRPRRRPDWTDMMKEVESGIKLKHVKCNDRSAPIIPVTKAKGQFVYESEKRNTHTPHNQLLKEIQFGVQLKKVKTNDRSKPILEGLRKFRRQMTIEEQIQKSASVADVVAVATEPDELDDIDKVRDDLQSTKQMLALEMRNKEALERENKRLIARLHNLEVELKKEKASIDNLECGRTTEDGLLIQKLKEEASQATAVVKEMEEKYHKTAEELDYTRAKLESAWLRNTQLEMELKSKGSSETKGVAKATSSKNLVKSMSNIKKSASAIKAPLPDEEEEEEGEEEEEEDEEEAEETETEGSDDDSERRVVDKSISQEEREWKLLTNRIGKMKDKLHHTFKERTNLKRNLNRIQKALKEEKKKYRALKKEVDKMASLMKEVGDEEEDDDEDVDDEEDSESSSEEDTEEESAVESEGDLPDEATTSDKIENLSRRIKNYDTRLTQTKRQNYFITANIDRRQDDLNRQKEMSLRLQEDLNEVLADLG